MKKKLKKFKLEAKKKIPIARTHLAKPIAKKIPNQNLSTLTQQFSCPNLFHEGIHLSPKQIFETGLSLVKDFKDINSKKHRSLVTSIAWFFCSYNMFLYYFFSGFVFVPVGYLHVLCTWLFALVL